MAVAKKARRTSSRTPAAKRTPADTASGAAAAGDANGLRVRMFRVGFGDFFLLTIPAGGSEKHILIDCGVHARDLKTIRSAVEQMAQDCDHHLSLVIMTHRHADHISGFATCSDIFKQITVDRVWMPWFEDPQNPTARAFQASLTAFAGRISRQLAARGDAQSEFAIMAGNITGGLDAVGVAANQKALDVLHGGFANQQPHDYYKAGDTAQLPDDLVAAGLRAEILGPPIDSALIGQMTNKSQQYLAEDAGMNAPPPKLFCTAFEVGAKGYGHGALKSYNANEIKAVVAQAQPDVLAAQADAADKTLNNQSLVVLFSLGGKNLLFAGDAQWGNWENFLYGGAYGTPGHTQLTAHAQGILNKIDFYKVGHHGSANATPKDAVAAMRLGCVGMCSTQVGAYNEVPREPLLEALRERMKEQLARSDQVAASADVPANTKAGPLAELFQAPTKMLYIDYNIP